jgi:hypothetical protein
MQRDLIEEAGINQSTPPLSPLDAIPLKNAQRPSELLPDKPATQGSGKISSPPAQLSLRELLGVIVGSKAPRGTFVSLSGFHPDAEAFARANRIFPMDGNALLEGMLKRPPQEQSHLLSVATEGDYRKPTCASCGIKMVQKRRKADQSEFWGCINYPHCKTVLRPRNALVPAS